MVLDQDAEEALHRADDGPVQHYGRMARVVFADVLGAQPSRHAEVDLHRAALPDAADAVLQRILDLRSVESALSRRHGKLKSAFLERLFQCVFRFVPELVGADARLGPGRDLVDDVAETEITVDLL